MLDASFPNANPEERAALEAAVDGAKTVESGMKMATKIRDNQRRTVKATGFRDKASSLMLKILSSPDIGDVTGSLEGAYDSRWFSDDEATLIADIEEAGDILTADNLDLMTGVLSESDIKLLRNLASGGLNRRRSEERFKADVTQLYEKLSGKSYSSGQSESGSSFLDSGKASKADALNYGNKGGASAGPKILSRRKI